MERQSAEERLEAALQKVLEQLPDAPPRQRALLLKRAGDICVGVEEPRKALGWYGRAVDQLLELGEAAEAARMCRLIVFVQPDAVRARCTLSWIAIGTGAEMAAEDVGAYAEAARQGGQAPIAAQQLEWMFEASSSPAVRERILLEMCTLDPDRAAGLADRLHALPATPGADEMWARVLEATVGERAQAARALGR